MTARFVFIVGFERCMTTSLASYVRSIFGCDLLVRGVKEPWIFSSDPEEAVRLLRMRAASNPGTAMFLDASTSYLLSPASLRAIAAAGVDYRMIVCMRNQFERAVSAFQYYRLLMTIALDTLATSHDVPEVLAALGREPRLQDSFLRTVAHSYYQAFGVVPTEFFGEDLGLWMAQAGADVPPCYVEPTTGRYSGTCILAAVMGRTRTTPALVAAADRECELLASQSLPARVMYELRQLRSSGSLPCLNVLANSHFAPALENLLEAVDSRRVLPLTMDAASDSPVLAASLADFLETPARLPGNPFPRFNDTGRRAAPIDPADLRRTELLLRETLAADTAGVIQLVDRHPHMTQTLFAAERLYHAPSGAAP